MALCLTTYPPFGLVVAPALSFVASTIELGAGSAAVDAAVPREFNLSATSLWILSFDVGVATGASLGGLVAWGLRSV